MQNIHPILKVRYKNFSELEKCIEAISDTTEKGTAFEQFVYFYFDYNSKYYNIAEIYMEKEIPIAIKNHLKLEKTDNGVDGVIIRTDAKVVAYQVKFRSNRLTPTASELSTFWAESEYADLRLIIANSYTLPKVTNKKKNQLSLLVDSFIDLPESFFEDMYSYFNTNSVILKEPLKPRDYQLKMINEILEGFKSADRGKMIAACGVGKTLTSLWLQEFMNCSTVIYVVPSLALIKQTLESWIQNSSQQFDYLCVCSDKTVVNNLDETDEINLSSSDVDFLVTTDTKQINNFLINPSNNKKVIFSTYHSLDAIVFALQDINDFKFDIGIFDESHRTAGSKDSQMFVYGLSDEYIPIKKRLFMTATERLVSPRILSNAETAGQTIFSMDDPSLYGETLTKINFGEAIEKDIISDYKIVVCTINEDDYINMHSNNSYTVAEVGAAYVTTSTDNLFKQMLLTKAIKELNLNKVITYHSYVKNAKAFINGNSNILPLSNILDDTLNTINTDSIFTGHINGSMSAGERKKLLESFEDSSYGIISNAKCLTEGIDVPVIDAIYFVDPKNSIVDIVQAVGRSLRKSNKKTNETSYILIPIVIPKSASIFSQIQPSSFDTLHNVIQAMRDQDSRLADVIDDLNFSAATNSRVPSKGSLGSNIIVLPYSKIGIKDFEESLHLRIAEVNKNPSSSTDTKIDWKEINQRKSDVKRVFVSIGDYSMDAYRNSLILPTLSKFESLDSEVDSKLLKVNHNNVSHTSRLGLIEKKGKNCVLTPLGRLLYNDINKYDSIVKEQLLKYYNVNKEDSSILFPYRALLKIFLEFTEITRFEFLYCLYSLRGTSEAHITQAIDRIYYLRETYPNIDILSEENKTKVLNLLNSKFGIEFGFKDIWTSRTTTYNQFNYFKKHLWVFDNIFINDEKDKEVIKIYPGSTAAIKELLDLTSLIETTSTTSLDELSKCYTQKISLL